VSIAQWGMECQAHIAYHQQLDAYHIPFYSNNMLDVAGAEELVKGGWPELRVLKIGWVGRPMLLWILLCTTWRARHEVIS
jgi:hypothetical protein